MSDDLLVDNNTPLNRYQFLAGRTALPVVGGLELVERTLGLGEEVAELYEKYTLLERCRGGALKTSARQAMQGEALDVPEELREAFILIDAENGLFKEAGDVLWYLSRILADAGLELGSAPWAVMRRAGFSSDALGSPLPWSPGHEWTFQDVHVLSFYLQAFRWPWPAPAKADGLPTGSSIATWIEGAPARGALLRLIQACGKVQGLVKKAYRDEEGRISTARQELLLVHSGFALCALAKLLSSLTCGNAEGSLAEVAHHNLLKLASRQERGTLKGDGDAR